MTFTKENWKEMQARRRDKFPSTPKASNGGTGRVVQAPPFPLSLPNWREDPLEVCLKALELLRQEAEGAGKIILERQSANGRKVWKCATCGVDVKDGEWYFKDDSRRDPKTGMLDPAVICRITPSYCYGVYWRDRPRLGPRK